jgi:hypothetical protein
MQRCGPEIEFTDLKLGYRFAHFEPATKSKLIATDKNRLDATTTLPPGMREAVCNKIAGGVPSVHTNHIRTAEDDIWMVKGLPWVRISLQPRRT